MRYETLKEHKEFQYIYKTAFKKHTNCFILFYKKGETEKVGFTASKKVGNAVKRNRAKRRLRALFAEFSSSLKSGSYVFIAKDSIDKYSHKELMRDMKYASKKMHLFL